MNITIKDPSPKLYRYLHYCMKSGDKAVVLIHGIEYQTDVLAIKYKGGMAYMAILGLDDGKADADLAYDKSPTAEECQEIITEISASWEIPEHMLTGNVVKSKSDNSWCERGEFPPVGTVCEYLLAQPEIIYHQCEIVCINGREIAFITPDVPNRIFITQQNDFRPVKTEKEKFVEAAKAISSFDGDSVLESGAVEFVASEMFDSGEFKYQPK